MINGWIGRLLCVFCVCNELLLMSCFKGAVVGPGEFLEGLSIGTQQFIEGTLGKRKMVLAEFPFVAE